MHARRHNDAAKIRRVRLTRIIKIRLEFPETLPPRAAHGRTVSLLPRDPVAEVFFPPPGTRKPPHNVRYNIILMYVHPFCWQIRFSPYTRVYYVSTHAHAKHVASYHYGFWFCSFLFFCFINSSFFRGIDWESKRGRVDRKCSHGSVRIWTRNTRYNSRYLRATKTTMFAVNKMCSLRWICESLKEKFGFKCFIVDTFRFRKFAIIIRTTVLNCKYVGFYFFFLNTTNHRSCLKLIGERSLK